MEKVGYLVPLLYQKAAMTYITTIDPKRLVITTSCKVTAIVHKQLYPLSLDVYAPWVLDAILKAKTLPKLHRLNMLDSTANNLIEDKKKVDEKQSNNLLLEDDILPYVLHFLIYVKSLIYAITVLKEIFC